MALILSRIAAPAFNNMDNTKELSASEQEKTEDVEMKVSEDLAALLRANLEMTKEIHAMVRHINSYVAWQRLFGWLKFLLLLIPLIIGVIYLPPLLREYYQQFVQLLANGAGI